MTSFLHDLRFAARMLRKSPGFATVAVLMLALGIGANTAIFSVLSTAILRPLPYGEQDRLMVLYEQTPQGQMRLASYPNFKDYRAQSSTLQGLTFVLGQAMTLRGREGVERLIGARVSEGFFEVLRTRPVVGRTFVPDEERPAGPRVAVLTHALWRRRFGGDPSIVGQTLPFSDGSYTVVGVMPAGFRYPGWAELFTPLSTATATAILHDRSTHVDSRVFGRLKDGVDVERAQVDLQAIAAQLGLAYPQENAGWGAQLTPLASEVVGNAQPQLWILMGAVACVLLIVCVNVANLSLVRGSIRAREIAIRTALGAGRWRVVRQLMAENILLAFFGALLGVAVAVWSVDLLAATSGARLSAVAPALIPRLEEVSVDAVVFAFAALLAVFTGIVTGLAPALQALGPSTVAVLKEGASGAGGGRTRRLRSAITVSQVALALALLIGAGLLVKSLKLLRELDPGFDSTGLLTIHVFPPAPRYDDPVSDVVSLYRRLAESIAPLPGVESAALVNSLPLSGTWTTSAVEVEGRPAPQGETEQVGFRTVSDDYFETMRIPLIRGRRFTTRDMTPRGGGALIVSEAMARRYWPDTNPIGKRLTVFKSSASRAGFGEPLNMEVAGVVADVRHLSLEVVPDPVVYVPYTASPWAHMFLVIRTRTDPAQMMGLVRRTLLGVDPDVALTEIGPMEEVLSASLAPREFTTFLLTAFAGAALLLSALGLYGVLSHLVGQRTRELGIRVALGATRQKLLALVIREGMLLIGFGAALGLAAALACSRLLRSLLYGVAPEDATTFLTGALLLILVAMFATLIPALRASRVDPAVALRHE